MDAVSSSVGLSPGNFPQNPVINLIYLLKKFTKSSSKTDRLLCCYLFIVKIVQCTCILKMPISSQVTDI
jgi:hypothetical protein